MDILLALGLLLLAAFIPVAGWGLLIYWFGKSTMWRSTYWQDSGRFPYEREL